MSTYSRRRAVAERIQRATGVRIEPVHPAGPIGVAYVVGYARVGASTAHEARRLALAERRAEDARFAAM